MTNSPLKDKIQNDMKDAMRARDQERLTVIRLIIDAIKRKEIDERIVLDDAAVLGVLDKMLKQRRESIEQYEAAKRQDLADKEIFEIKVIKGYLPAALSEEEIELLLTKAISATGAVTIKDMGKVMAIIKPQVQGRADMRHVSEKIKQKLS